MSFIIIDNTHKKILASPNIDLISMIRYKDDLT